MSCAHWHQDIQQLTYTRASEIKYRLRLTLGMLGGMVIGWFFKPSEIDVMASLSPMAIAFLMGYNVDVLFSIMDKVINTIRQSIEGKSIEGKTGPQNPPDNTNEANKTAQS